MKSRISPDYLGILQNQFSTASRGNRGANPVMAELLTLLPYLRRYRVPISCGIVLVIIANGFGLAAPIIIREAIDYLEQAGTDRVVLARYSFLILGAALLGGAARFGMRQLLNGVSRRVEFDLRNRLFEHLLHLDASFYGRMPTGEIMSRATNDIAAVRMVAGPAYMYLANTVFVSLFAISLMTWIDARLTLIAMAPMVFLPVVTIGFGNLIHRRFEAIQERFGDISTMVQENLAGVRIVKAYNQEQAQTERFADMAADYLDRNLSLARVSGLFHPLLGSMSGLALAGILLVGGRRAIEGSISVGDFVAFMLYLGMLTWPMIALGWVINLFQRGAASMRRINQIFASFPTIADPGSPAPIGEVKGEIEFRDVWFRFPGSERFALRGVSFRVPAGATLAVVGRTGSGKSVIAGLMARIFDPTAGSVLIDGVPAPEIPLSRLRNAIGMVPQDPFLFSETIRENLFVGAGDGDDADQRIRAAAGVAQFDRTIEELPGGYETLLGERGVNLSGGQKQRATLARAIARNPAVLILDDALSAVDSRTEAKILQGLQTVIQERTSVIISHRASAVADADLIIVLDSGEIVEAGTHGQLIERGGTYANLLRRQFLAEEVDSDTVLAAKNSDA